MVFPQGLTPLGMIDAKRGYLFSETEPAVLWLYGRETETLSPIIDLRDSERTIGNEMVFNERWLIWSEIAPYQRQKSGEQEREVRLMARDLSDSLETADLVLDTGTNPIAEGFSLPFDSLSLSGDSLVYRYTLFQNGNRDTEVRFVHLDEGIVQTLAKANHIDQQQILRCGLSDALLTWDVKTRYLQRADPLLPLTLKATYDLYYLRLEDGRLSARETPHAVEMQGDYYAPLVYRGSILALQQYEPVFEWTDPLKGNGDGPLAALDGTHIVNRSIDTSIVSLTPVNEEYISRTELVREYPYAQAVMKYYDIKASPRAIQRSHIFAGQRLLSWQSNVNEQHIVFDMLSYSFIVLPLYFEGIFDDAQTIQIETEEMGIQRREDFTYLPQLDLVNVRPVPGLDADYLYFSRFDTGEAYLLRICLE